MCWGITNTGVSCSLKNRIFENIFISQKWSVMSALKSGKHKTNVYTLILIAFKNRNTFFNALSLKKGTYAYQKY